MSTCSTPPKSSRGDKHTRIVDELRRRIVSGEIEPGARLPQFSGLRSEFGVAINTINRALFVLEQEQLIVREPGRGVFAAPKTKRALHGSVGCINFTDLDAAHSDYWFKIF